MEGGAIAPLAPPQIRHCKHIHYHHCPLRTTESPFPMRTKQYIFIRKGHKTFLLYMFQILAKHQKANKQEAKFQSILIMTYCSIWENVCGGSFRSFSLDHESSPANYGLINQQYKSIELLQQKFYRQWLLFTQNVSSPHRCFPVYGTLILLIYTPS